MRYARTDRVLISVAEYLRREEASTLRHEYFRGEVFAMSGGTRRHSLLAANIISRLHLATRGTSCHVCTSDFKVQPTDEAVYYPDVSVVCDEVDDQAVLTQAPCLVVEVTSRSSYRTDHGEKAQQYCASPSLRAYLIVDQNRRRVVAYLRDTNGAWERHEVTGDASIRLPCPAVELSLDEIYEDIALPPLGVAEPELDEATGEYVTARREI